MAQPLDKQIVWVVLFALAFWAGIWQHEAVFNFAHKVVVVVARMHW